MGSAVLALLVLLQAASVVHAFLAPVPPRFPPTSTSISTSKDTRLHTSAPRRPRCSWATAAAASSDGSSANAEDADEGQERAITLHTLELPVLEDPSEYRALLQTRFPGATLLRWHLSEVVERGEAGRVALAEVVIVERRGSSAASSSS